MANIPLLPGHGPAAAPGTSLPELAGAVVPSATIFAETPDSPRFTLGDKPGMIRTFAGTYYDVLLRRPSRGDLYGTWIVTEVSPERRPGEMGFLTVKYEATGAADGATLPADETDLQPFEINPRIERFYGELDDDVLSLVRQAVDGASKSERDDAVADLLLASETTAIELVKKLLRGQETYYLAGLTYTWTSSSWTVPPLTTGGVIQSPLGPLAAYLLPLGWQWLRKADALSYTNHQYKVTRTWMGAPDGHWDADIYPTG